MAPNDLMMLVSAEKEGDSYIVITHDTPLLRRFSEWVEGRPGSSDSGSPITKESVPLKPVTPAVPPWDPERTQLMPPKARVSKLPGDFETMFQRAAQEPPRSPFGDEQTSTPSRNEPSSIPASSPIPSNEPASAPGEFTRMFMAPTASASGQPVISSPEIPEAEAPNITSNESSPGEFTRMFQTPSIRSEPVRNKPVPSTPNTPESGAPQVAPMAEPGEFTRMFQAPAIRNEPAPSTPNVRESRAPQVPATTQPGEFTSMFRSPADKPAADPVLPPVQAPSITNPVGNGPGEFTKVFNSPFATSAKSERIESVQPPSPSNTKPTSAPGDFTKMFRPPSQESGGQLDRGGATGIFSGRTPPSSPSTQPPVPTGPSDYTLLMRASAQAPVPESSPVAPQAPKAEPASKKPTQAIDNKNAIWLIIVLAVLAVTAIALLLYFLMKK